MLLSVNHKGTDETDFLTAPKRGYKETRSRLF